jgi:hypothetical protein
MSYGPFDGYQWDRAKKNFAFLRLAEQEQRPFTLQELHEATGYSLATINKYRRRLWKAFLHPLPTGQFICNGLQQCSWEAFANLHAFLNRDLAMNQTPHLPTSTQEEQLQLAEEHPSRNGIRRRIAHLLRSLSEKVGG